MSCPVLTDQPRPVQADGDRQLLEGYVMNDLVVRPLGE